MPIAFSPALLSTSRTLEDGLSGLGDGQSSVVEVSARSLLCAWRQLVRGPSGRSRGNTAYCGHTSLHRRAKRACTVGPRLRKASCCYVRFESAKLSTGNRDMASSGGKSQAKRRTCHGWDPWLPAASAVCLGCWSHHSDWTLRPAPACTPRRCWAFVRWRLGAS